MPIPITQVDAFTNEPFAGNPAAICILDEPRDDQWMQSVAVEMNLAETAFLQKRDDGYDLRWFTPAFEVDLCGHATLAAAHVLWEQGHLQPGEQARFHTRSGLLTARRKDDWIELDFPAEPAEEIPPVPDLIESLGARPQWFGKNRMDHLVLVQSEQILRNIKPDMPRLASVTERGTIVTARADSADYDFVSRFFAPAAGVDEDPVTGSAHCCLAPFWQERLNKSRFTAYQASPRGGVLRIELRSDRVLIAGQAVTTLRAQLYC